MSKIKYELEDDELDEVTGGMNPIPANRHCNFFMPQWGKENAEEKCDNCFYFHGDEAGCSGPRQ